MSSNEVYLDLIEITIYLVYAIISITVVGLLHSIVLNVIDYKKS